MKSMQCHFETPSGLGQLITRTGSPVQFGVGVEQLHELREGAGAEVNAI